MHQERQNFGDIVRRTAFSFFLFAAVLTTLLTLSWYLLIPGLTRVEMGGSVLGFGELKEYKADLEAQILTLREQRSTYLRPGDHNLYERIKRLRKERIGFQRLRADIQSAISTLAPGTENVVQLSHFSYSSGLHAAELRGRVQNVGPRSMTVLAQFVEAIDRIPEVLSIESSRYTREETEEREFYSPFTIRLTIR